MRQVNIHEAKTHLSQLLEDVSHGEEVIIARAGKPIARLIGVGDLPSRQRGLLKGAIQVAPDFDAPLPEEVLATFEGDGA
jgi:prevent-host-death family protein